MSQGPNLTNLVFLQVPPLLQLENQEKMKQVQLELERAYLDAGRLDAENVPHSRVEICPLHVSWKLS